MKLPISLKYVPTLQAGLLYLLLFVVVLLLFFGRKYPSLQLPGTDAQFYSHISNFSISYFLVAGAGYIWIMLGVPAKLLLYLAALMLLANFIYELFIPILNTPDLVDAFFGTIGTIIALIFLLCIRRFGIGENVHSSA